MSLRWAHKALVLANNTHVKAVSKIASFCPHFTYQLVLGVGMSPNLVGLRYFLALRKRSARVVIRTGADLRRPRRTISRYLPTVSDRFKRSETHKSETVIEA